VEGKSVVQQNKQRLIENEDVAIFLNIIQFLRHNSKFLGVATAVLSAIAITFSLLTTPKQYHKQLTLSVRPHFPELAQPFPTTDVNQTSALALEFLNNADLEKVTAQPRYNAEAQQIELNLKSPDAKALSTAGPQVVSQLKKSFQERLSHTLETNLIALNLQLKRCKQIVAQLEQQIAQSSATKAKEALETQRASYITAIVSLESDKAYMEQSQKNLDDFTAQVISIWVLKDSSVQQTRSSGDIVVIAIVGSFLMAVLAALIRNQLPRLKDEQSKPKKIDTSTDI